MTVTTFLVEEAPPAPPLPARALPAVPGPSGPSGPGPRRASALVVMGVGLVVVALAVATGVRAVGHRPGRPGPAATASVPAPAEPAPGPGTDPSAITLAAGDVSVVAQVYEPGQSSGWHLHPGIHAVAVLSGVLTIYDSQCHPETFEPGRPYVGGQQPHLAVNQTGAPVVMSVTYLNPSTPAAPSEHVPAPTGCIAGQS